MKKGIKESEEGRKKRQRKGKGEKRERSERKREGERYTTFLRPLSRLLFGFIKFMIPGVLSH